MMQRISVVRGGRLGTHSYASSLPVSQPGEAHAAPDEALDASSNELPINAPS
jgi:hypothetical protein